MIRRRWVIRVVPAAAIISAPAMAWSPARSTGTRSKEQLLDLVVDGVLAEADTRADPAPSWTGQIRSGHA